MILAMLFVSFAIDVLLAVAVFALYREAGKRAEADASRDRTLGLYGEHLSDLRGRVVVADARLKSHGGHLEHLERVACKAHAQSVLTDDRLEGIEERAELARSGAVGRIEDAVWGLTTAANVLRLIPSQAAPDVTPPTVFIPETADTVSGPVAAPTTPTPTNVDAAEREYFDKMLLTWDAALRSDYGAGTLPPIDERHHDDDGPNQ